MQRSENAPKKCLLHLVLRGLFFISVFFFSDLCCFFFKVFSSLIILFLILKPFLLLNVWYMDFGFIKATVSLVKRSAKRTCLNCLVKYFGAWLL